MQGPAVDLFIASIGNRDPETESGPTGPLRGAQELRPRRVVLVALPGVEKQAEQTRRRIASELPGAEVVVEQLQVRDQVDMDELIARCGDLLAGLTGGASDQAVAVCANSGTPQLSQALTLAVMALMPRALHFQAADPAKTDRPWRKFDPDALRHHAELRAAFEMLATCRSQEAKGLLERRLESAATIARARQPALKAARAVAEALDLADGLDTTRALATLNVGTRALPDAAARDFKNLQAWYADFKRAGTDRNPHWPVELAARAHRQKTAGRIGEALIAAAIAFEVALTVRLRTAHNLDPDRVSESELDRIPHGLREHLRQRNFQVSDGAQAYRIEGAQDRSELLLALDRAYATLSPQTRVEPLVNARNRLVHAAKAPPAASVERFLGFLAEICQAFAWDDPQDCPSSPASVARLTAELRSASGLAPG